MIKKAIASGNTFRNLIGQPTKLPKGRITPGYKMPMPERRRMPVKPITRPMPGPKVPIKPKFPVKPITRPVPPPKKMPMPKIGMPKPGIAPTKPGDKKILKGQPNYQYRPM